MKNNQYTLLQTSDDFVEKLELKIQKIEKEKKNDKIFFLSIIISLLFIPIIILLIPLEIKPNIYLPNFKYIFTAFNDSIKYFISTFLTEEYIEIYKILILTLLIYFYVNLRQLLRLELK